jgi:hypothetical protein
MTKHIIIIIIIIIIKDLEIFLDSKVHFHNNVNHIYFLFY